MRRGWQNGTTMMILIGMIALGLLFALLLPLASERPKSWLWQGEGKVLDKRMKELFE